MPAATRSSSERFTCVVEAGCSTSERTSPRWVMRVNSWTAFVNVRAASRPPRSVNAKTEPCPRGRYCWASAWYGLEASPL